MRAILIKIYLVNNVTDETELEIYKQVFEQVKLIKRGKIQSKGYTAEEFKAKFLQD